MPGEDVAPEHPPAKARDKKMRARELMSCVARIIGLMPTFGLWQDLSAPAPRPDAALGSRTLARHRV
jgi:hypothetical protein